MLATHRVRFYGLPCWLDDQAGELRGTNILADLLIPLAAGLHNLIAGIVPGAGADGFPFTLVEEFSPARPVAPPRLGLGEVVFFAGAAVSVALTVFFLAILVVTAAHGAEIPRQALAYRATLTRAARVEWGLDAPVATFGAQIHQESGWCEDAKSPVGAQGLAQFMPATARWWSEMRPASGPAAPWNPGWALRSLAGYDKWLWDRTRAHDDCNRMAMSLAGYNGGLGWVRRDAALAAELGLDPLTWWDSVETANAGRSAANKRENQGYPRRILLTLEPLYEASGWGQGVCP